MSRFKERLVDAAKDAGTKAEFRRMRYGNIFTGRDGIWVLAVTKDPKYAAAGLFRNPESGRLRIEVYDSPISAQIVESAVGHAQVSRPPSHYFKKSRIEKLLHGYSPLR